MKYLKYLWTLPLFTLALSAADLKPGEPAKGACILNNPIVEEKGQPTHALPGSCGTVGVGEVNIFGPADSKTEKGQVSDLLLFSKANNGKFVYQLLSDDDGDAEDKAFNANLGNPFAVREDAKGKAVWSALDRFGNVKFSYTVQSDCSDATCAVPEPHSGRLVGLSIAGLLALGLVRRFA